jgi:hypothetical protein
LLLELKQIERTTKGLGKPLKHPNSLGSSNTQMWIVCLRTYLRRPARRRMGSVYCFDFSTEARVAAMSRCCFCESRRTSSLCWG